MRIDFHLILYYTSYNTKGNAIQFPNKVIYLRILRL